MRAVELTEHRGGQHLRRQAVSVQGEDVVRLEESLVGHLPVHVPHALAHTEKRPLRKVVASQLACQACQVVWWWR